MLYWDNIKHEHFVMELAHYQIYLQREAILSLVWIQIVCGNGEKPNYVFVVVF